MDEIENKPVSTPAVDSGDLREQIESLRHLIGSVLILLIIVSGTLTIFLRRELKTTSAQLDAFRPGATNLIAVYQKQQAPAMEEFAKRIQQYGRTHPDFAPILAKWDPAFVNLGWKLPASTSTSAPLTSPVSNSAPKK